MNCKEKRRYAREYYAVNKEQILQKQRAWREANREAELDRARVRYKANRDAILERQRAYREANRETIQARGRAYAAKWRVNNPDACAEYARLRRALGKVPLQDPDRYRDWCGAEGVDLVRDHAHPIALGGRDEPGNVVPSCAPCNLRKGAEPLHEWLRLLGAG
jgi:5-methylcytosine-specific restriction endonuclease McrA